MKGESILNAIKLIYPQIEGGFSYWETQSNGEPWENPIDGLVWENQEYSKPNWAQIEPLLAEIELQKAKEDKIAEIRERKEIELYKPVSYMGKTFFASERASGNIIASLLLNGDTVVWLDTNGDPVNMTKTQFQGLGVAIKNQRSAVYFIEAQKYKAIADAKTIQEVEAIIW